MILSFAIIHVEKRDSWYSRARTRLLSQICSLKEAVSPSGGFFSDLLFTLQKGIGNFWLRFPIPFCYTIYTEIVGTAFLLLCVRGGGHDEHI